MNPTSNFPLNATFEPASSDGERPNILLVDDEEYNRELLRAPLEARGHEVVEAATGAEALRLVAERPPDVILLDVMMPDLDGFSVCRMLKDNPLTASIPVLMVTALSDRKERLMGIGAGANDFLNKPIDVTDVMLRVGNAVYTRKLFKQLKQEQERSRRLLRNILPEPVAARMLNGEITIADHHPEATVLIADLVGFTTLAAQVDASQLVYLLNEIFSAFDLLAGKHQLEKIKTVGDAYMVVGGLPEARRDHAEAICELALDMLQDLERFNREYNTSFRLRIGVSTGPVVAGVIGRSKFAYDVWGNTVNLAFQLAGSGEVNQIHLSEATRGCLPGLFAFTVARPVKIKGRGQVLTYGLARPLTSTADELRAVA